MCLPVTLTWLKLPLTQPVRRPTPAPNSKYDKTHNSARRNTLPSHNRPSTQLANRPFYAMSLPTSSLHSPLNTDIINRKITWTLRFPLPAPAEGDPQNHRFADLALHASGHRSAAALRNALQLATTTAPPDHEPSNARFIRLLDPTNGHNNAIQCPAAPPSAAIIRWLRGGATRVSSRLVPDAATRPYCPEALFPYAPGSSPNTKRTSRRRSLKPKLHSTEPRRPIASPITVSKSTCQRPLFLTQRARPTPAQARRVSPCRSWQSATRPSLRRAGRRRQIQSDLAMGSLRWLHIGPSHGSLLVLALRLRTRT